VSTFNRHDILVSVCLCVYAVGTTTVETVSRPTPSELNPKGQTSRHIPCTIA